MNVERTCENCDKVAVCGIYRQVTAFNKAIEGEYGDLVKLLPSKSLALSCKEYLTPQIFSKWDQFNLQELVEIQRNLNSGATKENEIVKKISNEASAEIFRREQNIKQEAFSV